MKQLSIVDSPEIREKTKAVFTLLPATGVDPHMVVDLTKAIPSNYEVNAEALLFTNFKSDHLVDDTGVYHDVIEFQIKEIRRNGQDVWLFGDEYSLNLSEFSAAGAKMLEEVLASME